MTMEQPVFTLLLFPLSFVLVWLLVARITAMFGWDRLARTHAYADLPPAAVKFAYQSGSMSGTGYRKCLHIWTDSNSFYLRPSKLFAAFHPLLKIDYADIRAASPRQWRQLTGYAFQLPGDRNVINLFGPAAAAVHDGYQKNQPA